MRRKWIGILLTSGILGAPLCTAAQPEVTDEVLVRGTRLKDLKTAIAKAEDRFYVRYNELNKVDKYDVECRMDVHTGQRIPQRRCYAKLQLEAMAQHGQEVLEMFRQQAAASEHVAGQNDNPGAAGMTGRGRPPNTDPVAIWLAHYDDYRDNLLFLLKMNPELRDLAQAGEDAKSRYEAEYKRRLKGRLVLFE